jgi:geranylgeranyl diphosphate synthase type I
MISAILPTMTGVPAFDRATAGSETFRAGVEAELRRSIAATRERLEHRDPRTAFLADELARLIDAGGSLLRPVCCHLGFRAAGGRDGTPIARAGAALEFLHLMALIHDDVMDEAKERRGVPATHRHLAEVASNARATHDAERPADEEHTGRSLAILVGDLAEVCADVLFAESGIPPEHLARALERYHAVRLDMAAGQALDVLGVGDAPTVAALKGGSYTIAGPLLIGAALAGGRPEVEDMLRAFGEPLGTAFQLRDDLRDGDAAAGVDASTVGSLVAEARAALDGAPFDVAGLLAIADAVESA